MTCILGLLVGVLSGFKILEMIVEDCEGKEAKLSSEEINEVSEKLSHEILEENNSKAREKQDNNTSDNIENLSNDSSNFKSEYPEPEKSLTDDPVDDKNKSHFLEKLNFIKLDLPNSSNNDENRDVKESGTVKEEIRIEEKPVEIEDVPDVPKIKEDDTILTPAARGVSAITIAKTAIAIANQLGKKPDSEKEEEESQEKPVPINPIFPGCSAPKIKIDRLLDRVDSIYKFIPTEPKMYNYIVDNVYKMDDCVHKINGIAIYEDSGRFFDGYSKIEFFKKKNGDYLDVSGLLIGNEPFENRDLLLKNSNVIENGFYMPKIISGVENDVNSINLKRLIARHLLQSQHVNISNEKTKESNNKGVDIKDMNVIYKYLALTTSSSLIDEISQFYINPKKPDDKVYVCLCKTMDCEGGCTDVRKTWRRDLYNITL